MGWQSDRLSNQLCKMQGFFFWAGCKYNFKSPTVVQAGFSPPLQPQLLLGRGINQNFATLRNLPFGFRENINASVQLNYLAVGWTRAVNPHPSHGYLRQAFKFGRPIRNVCRVTSSLFVAPIKSFCRTVSLSPPSYFFGGGSQDFWRKGHFKKINPPVFSG